MRRSVQEVCNELGISPASYHRWQKQYGGADGDTVREYKALKLVNARLKRRLEEQALDIQGLKELAEGK